MNWTLSKEGVKILIEAVHDLADEYEQIFDAAGWESEDTAARRKQYHEMLAVARKLKASLQRRERKEKSA